MNKRFNWLYILISATIALNGAMVGSVIWMARQERPIGQRQYDQLSTATLNWKRKSGPLSNDWKNLRR